MRNLELKLRKEQSTMIFTEAGDAKTEKPTVDQAVYVVPQDPAGTLSKLPGDRWGLRTLKIQRSPK